MSFHVGDTAPDLTGTLTTAGSPKDVTGSVLEVHLRRPDNTVVTRAGVIVNATTGAWSMPWQAGDLTRPGNYDVEVQVTYNGGGIQTFGGVSFYVRAQIA